MLTTSAENIVTNEMSPRPKAVIGWENSSLCTRTYFIIDIPSLAFGKHVKCNKSTVKKSATLISASLMKLNFIPEYMKRTRLNIL